MIIKPMLAHPYDGRHLRFPILVEPKLDGIRCLYIAGTCYSRLGKVLRNVDHISKELDDFRNVYVFDGEVMGRDWNETSGTVHTHAQLGVRLKFNVFDAIPEHEWVANISSKPQQSRTSYCLANLRGKEFINPVVGTMARNQQEIDDFYVRCLAMGYEGVVIKDPSMPYMYRRHRAWMKIKPSSTMDCKVVGIQEGTGKYVGTMGALIVEIPDSKLQCGLGTGFDDAQRHQMWANPPIGQIVEVRYQEVTRDGVLRFPSFLRVRQDLTP